MNYLNIDWAVSFYKLQKNENFSIISTFFQIMKSANCMAGKKFPRCKWEMSIEGKLQINFQITSKCYLLIFLLFQGIINHYLRVCVWNVPVAPAEGHVIEEVTSTTLSALWHSKFQTLYLIVCFRPDTSSEVKTSLTFQCPHPSFLNLPPPPEEWTPCRDNLQPVAWKNWWLVEFIQGTMLSRPNLCRIFLCCQIRFSHLLPSFRKIQRNKNEKKMKICGYRTLGLCSWKYHIYCWKETWYSEGFESLMSGCWNWRTVFGFVLLTRLWEGRIDKKNEKYTINCSIVYSLVYWLQIVWP